MKTADHDQSTLRSLLFSEMLRKRDDEKQRAFIQQFANQLNFMPIGELMIGSEAWDHSLQLDVAPEFVFAHPDVLIAHPTTSLYYRGIALLSRKRVRDSGVDVKTWEDGTRKSAIPRHTAIRAACIYNAVITSIIEGSTNWTLENGYRNVLATMGIALDGMFRNKIGELAETLVKDRITDWLMEKKLISTQAPADGVFWLPKKTQMRYGSEPDIAFLRDELVIATIEIKGGTDPAGALERFGAMTKSFEATPPGCTNFLIAGVITSEMRKRLDEIGVIKVYLLADIAKDGEKWNEFTDEVFHHAIRVFPGLSSSMI